MIPRPPISTRTDTLFPDTTPFRSEELPTWFDSAFSGNATNVVGGVSMGALGAANLITHHPKLYTGLASYSGCLDNSESSSQDSVRLTVADRKSTRLNSSH